jgi:hypothetical protein
MAQALENSEGRAAMTETPTDPWSMTPQEATAALHGGAAERKQATLIAIVLNSEVAE